MSTSTMTSTSYRAPPEGIQRTQLRPTSAGRHNQPHAQRVSAKEYDRSVSPSSFSKKKHNFSTAAVKLQLASNLCAWMLPLSFAVAPDRSMLHALERDGVVSGQWKEKF